MGVPPSRDGPGGRDRRTPAATTSSYRSLLLGAPPGDVMNLGDLQDGGVLAGGFGLDLCNLCSK